MPVRILRPTLRTSERWHRSRYFDRCFYISLMNLVDDYGRYEANTTLLASECFPYGGEDGLPVTPQAIDGALRSLASKDLLIVYVSKNKTFLQLTRWKERKRTDSKYPDPETCEIVWKSEDCEHLRAVASKKPHLHASPPVPTPTPTPVPTPSTNIHTSTSTPRVEPDPQMAQRKKKFEIDGRFKWLSEQLCAMYKRPSKTVGIGEEEWLVAEIARRPDVKAELEELKKARAGMGEKYFPQSLKSLCSEWDKTLDRARNQAGAPKPFKDLSIPEKELAQFYRRENL